MGPGERVVCPGVVEALLRDLGILPVRGVVAIGAGVSEASFVRIFVAGGALGGSAGAVSGAGGALSADLYNRQLHQSERDWAKKNAHKFADYYKDQTGKTISDEEAYQKLLSAGYAMVDDTTSRSGGSDEKAKQFIGENKTAGLFDATALERATPLLGGNPDGSMTPEQQARTGTKNPTVAAQQLYEETLQTASKPCTDAYACGTKVGQVTAAVQALQQERALYQDDPAKRQQIEGQERQLLSGITSQEWRSAKLAQADASTLMEVLGFVGAPALTADIAGALTRIGANGAKVGGPSVVPKSGALGETGNAVQDLLYGAKPGQGLPGSAGVPISERPTVGELENLTEKHHVEFAVVYQYGAGPNGRGGQYYLYSGTTGAVEVPVGADQMLIYHTHPGGTPFASQADMDLLDLLKAFGSPQRSSQIVPVGKPPVRFGPSGRGY